MIFKNVFTKTSNLPLKNLNDANREMNDNILKSLDFVNYKGIRG